MSPYLDTPRYRSYEFKGGDEDFPAFQVLEKKTGRQLARVPWPGDSSNTSLSRLRERTAILWRQDSQAVAINTRDPHYWSTVLLVRSHRGAFVRVPLPGFEAIAGRPRPKGEDLAARGVEEAREWTSTGNLVYYSGLAELNPISDPLTYLAVLKVSAKGCSVVSSKPVPPDR